MGQGYTLKSPCLGGKRLLLLEEGEAGDAG